MEDITEEDQNYGEFRSSARDCISCAVVVGSVAVGVGATHTNHHYATIPNGCYPETLNFFIYSLISL
jgi:hypothetical protein